MTTLLAAVIGMFMIQTMMQTMMQTMIQTMMQTMIQIMIQTMIQSTILPTPRKPNDTRAPSALDTVPFTRTDPMSAPDATF